MSKPDVVVLDYGSGNIRSAEKALTRAGADVTVTADIQAGQNAAGLVVPGVGAFRSCVTAVKKLGADRMIEQRLIANHAVLGICVGMQMMFASGEEGGDTTNGLGQLSGTVQRLDARVIPHMGWNFVESAAGSSLFQGLSDAQFYFVHSFAVTQFPVDEISPIAAPKVSYTTYENRFVSAVENGPLSAVQFHPEKSGEAGIELLRNWVKTL